MAFLRWMSLASIAAKIVLKHPEGCEVAHISRKFLDPLTRGAACKAEIPDAMLLHGLGYGWECGTGRRISAAACPRPDRRELQESVSQNFFSNVN